MGAGEGEGGFLLSASLVIEWSFRPRYTDIHARHTTDCVSEPFPFAALRLVAGCVSHADP